MKKQHLAVGIVLLGLGFTGSAAAQKLETTGTSTSLRIPTETAAAAGSSTGDRHSLDVALKYTTSVMNHVQRHIRDYTCVLVKRERIDGDLQDTQYINAFVRASRKDEGRQIPLGVYLEFVAPQKVQGRKVLYVAGQNDGQMLVRNGGKRFNYVTLKVAPDSEAALRESRAPITEIGFENMTKTFLRLIQENIRRDPTSANTKLSFFKGAKVNDRSCTRVQVNHPQVDPDLEFSEVSVYVDDELRVPIRVEAYDWPSRPDQHKPLMFEYTYENLKLNVGLTDANFSRSLLQAAQPAN